MDLPTGPAVVLTRERADNQALARALRDRGVPVVEIPCLATRVVRPAALPAQVAAVAFTSRRGVLALGELMLEKALLGAAADTQGYCSASLRGPARGVLTAAVGQATAQALREAGLPVDLVAEPPTGQALADRLIQVLPAGAVIAVVRGNLRAGGLDEALGAAGLTVAPVEVYENVAPEIPALAPFPVATVFVASPSAAQRLLEKNPWLRHTSFCAIGPTTAQAIRELGVAEVDVIDTDSDGWAVALTRKARRAQEPKEAT